MRSLRRSAVVSLAIAAVIISTAVAQGQSAQQGTSPGWAWGPRGMMGGFMGPGMMALGGMGSWMMGGSGSAEAMCSVMGSHIEGRLAYVRAELKVTDAQESLWSAYAAAARDSAKTMVARCTTMMNKPDSQVSLPDRLDQNEQLMSAQLGAVRASNKALKPLYAALSDDQKKTADQLFWGPMGKGTE